jgi:hypothetical protein
VPVTVKDKQEFSGLCYSVERQCNKSVAVNPPEKFLLLNFYGVNSNTNRRYCLGHTVSMSCLLPFFLFLPNLDKEVQVKRLHQHQLKINKELQMVITMEQLTGTCCYNVITTDFS